MIILSICYIVTFVLVIIMFNKFSKLTKSYEKRIADLEYAIGYYYKNSRGEI